MLKTLSSSPEMPVLISPLLPLGRVIGFLTETFARRRYVEEIDKATRGVLGALS